MSLKYSYGTQIRYQRYTALLFAVGSKNIWGEMSILRALWPSSATVLHAL